MKKFLYKIPNHFYIAASSLVAKLVIALVQVISIHYLLNILGENKYAAFVLLSGFLVFFGGADFGIGSSLQNYISERRAKNEKYNDYIKASVNIIILGLVLWWGGLSISSSFLSELYLSSFTESDVGDKAGLFFSASMLFCSVSCGAVVCKVWFAEQIGWKANIVSAVAYLIGVFGIWYFHKMGINPSVKLSLVVMFSPLSFITLSFLFKKYWGNIKLSVDLNKYFELVRRGFGFFAFNILSVLVLQADYIVMSQKLSPADIVTYSVLMKIFTLAFFIYSALLQALWPVCAEMSVCKRWNELNKIIISNILGGSLIIVFFTFFIFTFKNELIFLVSEKIDTNINYIVFFLFGFYFVIRVWCDTFAVLLQSMNYLKPLLYLVPAQAIIGISAQWVFTEKYGIIGILLGLILAFLCTVVWGLPFFYYKRIKGK